MNYEIVQLQEFEGNRATIYTILMEDDETLFELFLAENHEKFPDEVLSILNLIEDINEKYGARENLFKINEGSPQDGLVAIYDNPDKNLRLYAIRFGSGILILGNGAPKSKDIKAYQEDKKLDEIAKQLKVISREINRRIEDKEIWFSQDGSELLGNLIFSNDEDE